MKSGERMVWVGLVILGLTFALSPDLAGETIKLGVVGPRTVPAAAAGRAFEEGIKLATDYVNQKGGVLGKKLEVVFEDTAGAPDKAASGFWARGVPQAAQ